MDKKMKERLEYEQQFYGFSSQFVDEGFQNFMRDELKSAVEFLTGNIRNKLINDSMNPEAFKEKMKEMTAKLVAEYDSSLEAERGSIGEDIRKHMTIPDHVLLKEDLPVKTGLTEDLSAIEREIKDLKGRLNAINHMKHKIMEEIEKADAAIFIMDSIINKTTLDGIVDDGGIVNMDEILSLARSNLSIME